MLSHDRGIAPPGRDEAAGTKAAGHIKSKKSLQKTVMAGRHPHRMVRYHGRIGFTRHQRELLIARIQFPCAVGIADRDTEKAVSGNFNKLGEI